MDVVELGQIGRHLIARLRRVPDREDADAVAPGVAQPCVGCGEETAAGSVFYWDRLSIARPDGSEAYLCSACHAKARAAKRGGPLTSAGLEVIAGNGLMIGVGFLGSGGF